MNEVGVPIRAWTVYILYGTYRGAANHRTYLERSVFVMRLFSRSRTYAASMTTFRSSSLYSGALKLISETMRSITVCSRLAPMFSTCAGHVTRENI